MEKYLNLEEIFQKKSMLLEKLKLLHEKKYWMKELLAKGNLNSPFIIEVSGTPRAGKTTCVENLVDFFKSSGIETIILEEPAAQLKKMYSLEELRSFSNKKFNDETLKISEDFLFKAKMLDCSIILMDRGVLDNYIWYEKLYQEGAITDEEYQYYFSKRIFYVRELLDYFFLLTCSPKTAILREHYNSLSLEPRKKTNMDNVNKLNASTENVKPIFSEVMASRVQYIDTTRINIMDTSILLADQIMDQITRKLVLE